MNEGAGRLKTSNLSPAEISANQMETDKKQMKQRRQGQILERKMSSLVASSRTAIATPSISQANLTRPMSDGTKSRDDK